MEFLSPAASLYGNEIEVHALYLFVLLLGQQVGTGKSRSLSGELFCVCAAQSSIIHWACEHHLNLPSYQPSDFDPALHVHLKCPKLAIILPASSVCYF